MNPKKQLSSLMLAIFLCAQVSFAGPVPTAVLLDVDGMSVTGSQLIETNGSYSISYFDPGSGRRKQSAINGDLATQLLPYMQPNVLTQDPLLGPSRSPRAQTIWNDRAGQLEVYDHLLHVKINKGKVDYIGASYVSMQDRSKAPKGAFQDISHQRPMLARYDWRAVPVRQGDTHSVAWIEPTDEDGFKLHYERAPGRVVTLPLSSYVRRELAPYDNGQAKLHFEIDGDPTNGGHVMLRNGVGPNRSLFPGEHPIEQKQLLRQFDESAPSTVVEPTIQRAALPCAYDILRDPAVLPR